MNPQAGKKFGEFRLLCKAYGAVMAPSRQRALFDERALLLTERMLPIHHCSACGVPSYFAANCSRAGVERPGIRVVGNFT
jgi:hypothetical protein